MFDRFAGQVLYWQPICEQNLFPILRALSLFASLAQAHGVPAIRYCAWDALDLVSTQNGYQKRYGLIYVDREGDDTNDCRRIPKLSYTCFQKVIASNGHDLELTEELNGESE